MSETPVDIGTSWLQKLGKIMGKDEILEELEFELYMLLKSDKSELIPGLEHAIKLINEM